MIRSTDFTLGQMHWAKTDANQPLVSFLRPASLYVASHDAVADCLHGLFARTATRPDDLAAQSVDDRGELTGEWVYRDPKPRKAVDLALAGDGAALRLCLDRIAPPRKDTPIAFDLPPMQTAADAAKVAGAVLDAVAGGDLTPREGAQIMALVETYRRTLETTDLEARLAALEANGDMR